MIVSTQMVCFVVEDSLDLQSIINTAGLVGRVCWLNLIVLTDSCLNISCEQIMYLLYVLYCFIYFFFNKNLYVYTIRCNKI